MAPRRCKWTWLATAALLAALPACQKTDAPAAQQPFDPDSGPFAPGKQAMVAAACFRCHAIGGVRGPVSGAPPVAAAPVGTGLPQPSAPAPDLGEIGRDPEH